LAYLPSDLAPVAEVAYITGWRVASEIVTRTWAHVDFKAGWIRLEPGETKNRAGRMFPLTSDLRAVLESQRERTDALERSAGRIVPWVFWRVRGPGVREDGIPVRSFRKAWKTACARAGVPGRIPHDFRRTAVRNLERAGVPRSSAMAMVGHKTETIYRRYAITDEGMLREAGSKLAKLHEQQRSAAEADTKVVSGMFGTTPSGKVRAK
jgi:integrase